MYYRIFILFCVFFATKSVLIWNWSTPVRIRDESEMKVNTKLNNERVTLWSVRLRSMIRPIQISDACLRPLGVAPLWLLHLSVCSPSKFYRVYIYVYIYMFNQQFRNFGKYFSFPMMSYVFDWMGESQSYQGNPDHYEHVSSLSLSLTSYKCCYDML